MKIIISETQYLRLIEGENVIDKILDKISDGDKLMIDEKKCLDAYSEHIKKGLRPEDFKCPEIEYDDREGEVFVSNLKDLPEIKFTFSEQIEDENEIQYFGEIQFDGEEYLGSIITDKRGYLIDFDFYNVSDEINDYSFQDVIKGMENEVEFFFQEEVINNLRK